MITARRPTRSASGAINRQPIAMPKRLALNSSPRCSGLTFQVADRTGAMKDMISKSVPSSMLSRKHNATTFALIELQPAVSVLKIRAA